MYIFWCLPFGICSVQIDAAFFFIINQSKTNSTHVTWLKDHSKYKPFANFTLLNFSSENGVDASVDRSFWSIPVSIIENLNVIIIMFYI